MAALLRHARSTYSFIFIDLADHRLISWPLIAKPYQTGTILVLYLMFIFKWGPEYMKNRQPFNLKKILIMYNTTQIVVCAVILYQAIYYGWGWTYKWVCEPIDFSESALGLTAAKLTYCYFLTKLLDLMDTVFFVLRKKYNQVTFLHMYHHAGMVLLIWGTVTYLPGGHCTFLGVINCFVHMIMYSYYLLSVVAPETTKNLLWFKKLITQLQILQFLCGLIHTSLLLFEENCAYPQWVCAILIPQNFFILALFTDFYIKTYIKAPKNKIKERNNMQLNGNCNKGVNGLGKIVRKVDEDSPKITDKYDKIN